MRLALLHLSPLAGRDRIPSAAQAERRNPGEGDSRRSQFVQSPPHPARSWRCSPTSPPKRGEGKRRRAPYLSAYARLRGSCRRSRLRGASANTSQAAAPSTAFGGPPPPLRGGGITTG